MADVTIFRIVFLIIEPFDCVSPSLYCKLAPNKRGYGYARDALGYDGRSSDLGSRRGGPITDAVALRRGE